jgi:hypothetical protein
MTEMTRTKLWAVALAALIGLGAFSIPQTAEAGRGWYGPGWRHGYWGPRRGYWGPGPYWGAGAIGLGVGLAIGSALAAPAYIGPPPVYAPPPPGAYAPGGYGPGPDAYAPDGYAADGYAPAGYDQGGPSAYGPAQGSSDWIAYCSQRYRSFNPQTGMFTGYDGLQHPCQ